MNTKAIIDNTITIERQCLLPQGNNRSILCQKCFYTCVVYFDNTTHVVGLSLEHVFYDSWGRGFKEKNLTRQKLVIFLSQTLDIVYDKAKGFSSLKYKPRCWSKHVLSLIQSCVLCGYYWVWSKSISSIYQNKIFVEVYKNQNVTVVK